MNGDGQVEFPLVNRVEVIDRNGRSFVEYLDHAGCSIQMQDGGRTMKLYVDGPKAPAEVIQLVQVHPFKIEGATKEERERLGLNPAPRLPHNRGVA